MSQYRKILLIADPDLRGTPAYHRAVRLARASGAQLHVCLFAHSTAIAAAGIINSKVAEMAKWGYVEPRERWLREQAGQLAAQGIAVKTDLVWGAPVHERILEKILQVQPDLVIKDAHLEPALKRILFTPLDWHLLRLCPKPLLMVRSARRKLPRKIVAAIDTAHPLPNAAGINGRIVDAAAALAAQCHGNLHLVHSFEDLLPVVPGEVVSSTAFDEAFEKLRRTHRQRFDAFADQYRAPAENRHFIIGPSAYALAEFARESKADVLVLGTTHRTGLDRIVIGSTAEDILPDVRCDVLAVKPEGFERELEDELDIALPRRAANASPGSQPLKAG